MAAGGNTGTQTHPGGPLTAPRPPPTPQKVASCCLSPRQPAGPIHPHHPPSPPVTPFMPRHPIHPHHPHSSPVTPSPPFMPIHPQSPHRGSPQFIHPRCPGDTVAHSQGQRQGGGGQSGDHGGGGVGGEGGAGTEQGKSGVQGVPGGRERGAGGEWGAGGEGTGCSGGAGCWGGSQRAPPDAGESSRGRRAHRSESGLLHASVSPPALPAGGQVQDPQQPSEGPGGGAAAGWGAPGLPLKHRRRVHVPGR